MLFVIETEKFLATQLNSEVFFMLEKMIEIFSIKYS